MANILINLIYLLASIILWVVFLNFIFQFFLEPYHPWRAFLYRILQPLLRPIRQYVPPSGGLDFSPMVLIFLVILIRYLLISVIRLVFS